MTIAFDTETHLIGPGMLAPPLVCVQWQERQSDPSWAFSKLLPPEMLHREASRPRVELWLNGDETLVGHNVSYDMGVIGAQWPDLLPAIFDKYDRDEVTDTLIREQLIMIGRGTFKFQMGDVLVHKAHAGLPPASKESFQMFQDASIKTCVRFVVTERVAQECPGGVQLHYICRGVKGMDVGTNVDLLEEELMLFPGFGE